MVSVALEWLDKWEGDTVREGCGEKRRQVVEKYERNTKRGERSGEKEGRGESEAGNETVLGQS